jgi:hypothetical protein
MRALLYTLYRIYSGPIVYLYLVLLTYLTLTFARRDYRSIYYLACEGSLSLLFSLLRLFSLLSI